MLPVVPYSPHLSAGSCSRLGLDCCAPLAAWLPFRNRPYFSLSPAPQAGATTEKAAKKAAAFPQRKYAVKA